MTVYSTDASRLTALVEAAAQCNTDIESRVSIVERRITDLHLRWQGDSAEQHRDNAEKWQRSMGDMREVLARLRAAVDNARSSYVANVEHNRRMWP